MMVTIRSSSSEVISPALERDKLVLQAVPIQCSSIA